MDTQDKKIDARRLIITITLVLVTALLVGGGVWYFMDQNQKDIQATNEKTTQDLQKQIDALNTKSATTPQSTTTTPAVAQPVDYQASLTSYCKVSNPGMTTGTAKIYQEGTGVFGSCGVNSPDGGGAIAFYKYVDTSWTRLFTGNGLADKSVCEINKVPQGFWFCMQ